MEEWRDIPSLPGYQASSEGRIRSVARRITDSRGRSYLRPGVVRKLGVAPNGYLRLNTGEGQVLVHRAVLEAFSGPAPVGHHGAHRDGDRSNNKRENLRWATPVENAADKAIHGTAYRPIGALHHGAKLSEDQVRQIKRLYASGVLQSHIALMTGVQRKTVNSIVRGRSWAHIEVNSQGRSGANNPRAGALQC